jgi:hypothetical protein
MSASLTWKLNRLKAMKPAEVCWRVRQAAMAVIERWGFGLAREVNPTTGTSGSAWAVALPADISPTLYVNAADRVLAGRWDVFSLRACPLGFPPLWNHDPKTGVEAPLVYGKSIDYRNERVVGDIKYLWELNRHLELVTLAQAWYLTREPRYAEGARCLLQTWLEQCPYARGPQWASSLELGVRLVNWACAWHLLGGEASPLFTAWEGQEFRRRWLEAIYQHCHFISGNLSRHSSANNHLFGELMGLFIAAVTWPLWPESARWREGARDELEIEAVRQNGEDGVNREQAIWYHHEVADMMVLCLLFGRANGIHFSGRFRKQLERMLEFIASMMDAGGHVPMIGDADDAVMVRFSREPAFCPYRSLLATGAVLFRRGDFKAKAGALDHKTRWLLGEGTDAAYRKIDATQTRLPVSQAFTAGGYYILGCDFETESEIRLVADAGPLGYQAIAAHGHADALAFSLSVGGLEFLIDPGTYAYHTQHAWRQYFRGTAAHNTLRVDAKDQSEPGGNFMWLRKARADCNLWSSASGQDVLEGWHDGYLRLADPVMHRRRITLDKAARRIVIDDTLQMAAGHLVELFFHCSEQCQVRRLEDGYAVRQRDKILTIKLPRSRGAVSHLYHGSFAPISGWVSRRFDEKQPSPTIAWRARIEGKAALRSEIIC